MLPVRLPSPLEAAGSASRSGDLIGEVRAVNRLRAIANSWTWDELGLGLVGLLVMRLAMEFPENAALLTASWLLGMGCVAAAWWLRRKRLSEEALALEDEGGRGA